jgi:hypothetical protein
MNTKPEDTKAASAGPKGVTRVIGATFVGVLLGLVLKNLLDTFFRNASLYNGVGPAVKAVIDRGWFSTTVTGQLLILIFSLVRFYLGSSRYHQEEPEIEGGAAELVVDLIGAIGVFVSFYIASVFIKNTSLFYVGFGLIHIVDLAWFLIAKSYLPLNEGMEKVAGWYLFFDAITFIPLIGFFVLDTLWGPWSWYFPQWLALGICFGIGFWDLKKLWPFYAGTQGWQKSLRKRW